MECKCNEYSAAHILDRFYEAFIDLKIPADFFIGMADYLQFADSIPRFDRVSAAILEVPKPLRKELGEIETKALTEISKRKKEITTYIKKNKIEDPKIAEALESYVGWENGWITGSPPKPISMMLRLEDIVNALFGMPDHKAFGSQYLIFSHDRPTVPMAHILPKSFERYQDLYNEIERGGDRELWGHVENLAWLFDVLRQGTKKYKSLKEKAEQGDKKAEMEAYNYGFLLWEWKQLEDHKKWGTSDRNPAFFAVEKVRPWLARLHLQFLASKFRHEVVPNIESQDEASERVLASTEGLQVPKKKPRLLVQQNPHKKKKLWGYIEVPFHPTLVEIAGVETLQFRLIVCLFSAENEVNALYSPQFQTLERVCGIMTKGREDQYPQLKDRTVAPAAQRALVERTIDELQKKMLGKYLRFERNGNTVRLAIPSEREG